MVYITRLQYIDILLSLCYCVVMDRLSPIDRNHPYYHERGDFRDTQHYFTDRALYAVFEGIRRAGRVLGIGRVLGKTIGIDRGHDNITTEGATPMEVPDATNQAAVAPIEQRKK